MNGHFSSKRLRKLIKSIDEFGVPVNLTFKGDPFIKSMTGGLMTLVARIMVFSYFIYQLSRVIRSDYSLQSSMLVRNLQDDKSVITLDSFDKFDFAVKLEYLMDKKIPL